MLAYLHGSGLSLASNWQHHPEHWRLHILLKGHPHNLPPDGGEHINGGCREFTCTFSSSGLPCWILRWPITPSKLDPATELTVEILKLTAPLSLSLLAKVWVTPGLVNESNWVPFLFDVDKAECGKLPRRPTQSIKPKNVEKKKPLQRSLWVVIQLFSDDNEPPFRNLTKSYRFTTLSAPLQQNIQTLSCLIYRLYRLTERIIPQTSHRAGLYWKKELLWEQMFDSKLAKVDNLCRKVCRTVLTGYFVLYRATIRAGYVHLFAYSVALSFSQ